MKKYEFIGKDLDCNNCCFYERFPIGCTADLHLAKRFRSKCILGEGIWQIKLTLNSNIKVL